MDIVGEGEFGATIAAAPGARTDGEGFFGVFIWPVYVGLSNGEPDPTCSGEPFYHPDYQRGQIMWTMPNNNGIIVGHAKILLPAGGYTHLTYHYGPSIWPSGPQLMGHRQLEFALRFPQAGTATIDPINQGDWVNTVRAERNGNPAVL